RPYRVDAASALRRRHRDRLDQRSDRYPPDCRHPAGASCDAVAGMEAHVTQASATPQQLPSARTLMKASAVALAVASVLLMAIVFPAEYGIDPLGTGEAFGLSALSGTSAAQNPTP